VLSLLVESLLTAPLPYHALDRRASILRVRFTAFLSCGASEKEE